MATSEAPSLATSPPLSGFRELWSFIAVATGLLLMTAAGFKLVSPADSYALRVTYDVPWWLLVASLQFELAVAFWLISGWQAVLARRASIALFAAFAVFSLYRALAGYETCGCFGSMRVNPWLTFLFDLSMVAVLASVRPAVKAERDDWSVASVRRLSAGLAYLGVTAFVLVRSTVLANIPENVAGVTSTESLVILEPEKWVGQDFPLSHELSPKVDFNEGKWLLLFYHHDCSKCQELIPRYEAFASQMAKRREQLRVALIEVPPVSTKTERRSQAIQHMTLNPAKEWFVQTPMALMLESGIVKSATSEMENLVP